MAETLSDENMRSLLLRFASALSSGEGEAPFLAREMEVQLELYGKAYERDLETLQRWTDAYVALMVSAALIVVISLVSMMIYSMGGGLIIGLAVVVIGTTFLGSWIVYTVAPLEVKACTLADFSHERHFAALLARYVLPVGLAASAGVMLLGFGLALAFITMSVFLLPIGVLAMREDLQIDRRDRDISQRPARDGKHGRRHGQHRRRGADTDEPPLAGLAGAAGQTIARTAAQRPPLRPLLDALRRGVRQRDGHALGAHLLGRPASRRRRRAHQLSRVHAGDEGLAAAGEQEAGLIHLHVHHDPASRGASCRSCSS